jgi:hypothetical protein
MRYFKSLRFVNNIILKKKTLSATTLNIVTIIFYQIRSIFTFISSKYPFENYKDRKMLNYWDFKIIQ